MFRIRKPPTVQVGDKRIEVRPLTLENSLRLVLLLSPHVTRITQYWPQIQASLENEPGLLELLLKNLAQELAFAPGDITQAFALCLDVEPEFVARNATAKDLVEALSTLDRINNFRGLFQACEALGVTVNG